MTGLDEFDTLEDAQAYYHIGERMVTADMLVSLLTEYDSVLTLESAATSNNDAAGLLLALSGAVTEYNVITGSYVGDKQQAKLASLVTAGALTQMFVDTIIQYANFHVTYPYQNTTLARFNMAKGIHSKLIIPTAERGEQYKIRISSNVEKCAITAWSKELDYDYKNLGKPIFVESSAHAYKLDLRGIDVDGVLELRIPIAGVTITEEKI